MNMMMIRILGMNPSIYLDVTLMIIDYITLSYICLITKRVPLHNFCTSIFFDNIIHVPVFIFKCCGWNAGV